MKIAYVFDQLILCGGVIVPFQHCRELRKRGYDAFIVANGKNEKLQNEFSDVPVYDIDVNLKYFTDDDIIIAAWWMQVPILNQYKGRKIQFVQGNDLLAYIGDDLKKRCLEIRQDDRWELMAVSDYAGNWTERNFEVVPNAIDEKFFDYDNIEKKFDILIEGNNEENKGIDKALDKARSISKSIAWLGRETKETPDVINFTNPPREQIPKIYRDSKCLIKVSDSEGFCLPILEAMASRCLVVTHDMGGNDFCEYGFNCVHFDDFNKLEIDNKILENGYQTAKKYTWKKSVNKLEAIFG